LKVLLIEDEKTLAYEVEAFLKKAFYICDLAHTARKGLEMLGVNPYDFVLLDLGLPDLDGLKVLQEAKKLNPDAAYIILTARGNIEDRIVGLDLGADDYLVKPFEPVELVMRVKALLKRYRIAASQTVQIGELLMVSFMIF